MFIIIIIILIIVIIIKIVMIISSRKSSSRYSCIVRRKGRCMGGDFNIHIWAWLASPSVQVERFEKWDSA